MAKEMNIFGEYLRRSQGKASASCAWAKVTKVDWDAKTMDCMGVEDELEYFDVLLGLGSEYRKPAKNSLVLIGSINNNDASMQLIHASKIEEWELQDIQGFKISLKDGKLTLNGESLGGLVDAKEVKSQVEKNSKLLEKIQSVFSNWTPVAQDGGSALKVASSQFLGMETADMSNIENPKILHGNG